MLRRGDPAGIRTPDPLLKRQLLCRLSYRVMVLCSAAAATRIVWLGRLDSNQRMRESKSLALPLGDAPMWKEIGDRGDPDPLLCLGWEMGLEPSTPGTTIRCSNQLSYTHHISCTRELATYSKKVARQKGLEPLAHCLEGSCSIQLSYWREFDWSR